MFYKCQKLSFHATTCKTNTPYVPCKLYNGFAQANLADFSVEFHICRIIKQNLLMLLHMSTIASRLCCSLNASTYNK